MNRSATIGIWIAVAFLALLAGAQVDSLIGAMKHGAAQAHVGYACGATLNEFSCTATNLNDFDVIGVCIAGKLKPRGDGKPAEALPVCTGRMAPRSTIMLTSRWSIGSPGEACPSDNRLVPLDWNACDLTISEL